MKKKSKESSFEELTVDHKQYFHYSLVGKSGWTGLNTTRANGRRQESVQELYIAL